MEAIARMQKRSSMVMDGAESVQIMRNPPRSVTTYHRPRIEEGDIQFMIREAADRIDQHILRIPRTVNPMTAVQYDGNGTPALQSLTTRAAHHPHKIAKDGDFRFPQARPWRDLQPLSRQKHDGFSVQTNLSDQTRATVCPTGRIKPQRAIRNVHYQTVPSRLFKCVPVSKSATTSARVREIQARSLHTQIRIPTTSIKTIPQGARVHRDLRQRFEESRRVIPMGVPVQMSTLSGAIHERLTVPFDSAKTPLQKLQTLTPGHIRSALALNPQPRISMQARSRVPASTRPTIPRYVSGYVRDRTVPEIPVRRRLPQSRSGPVPENTSIWISHKQGTECFARAVPQQFATHSPPSTLPHSLKASILLEPLIAAPHRVRVALAEHTTGAPRLLKEIPQVLTNAALGKPITVLDGPSRVREIRDYRWTLLQSSHKGSNTRSTFVIFPTRAHQTQEKVTTAANTQATRSGLERANPAPVRVKHLGQRAHTTPVRAAMQIHHNLSSEPRGSTRVAPLRTTVESSRTGKSTVKHMGDIPRAALQSRQTVSARSHAKGFNTVTNVPRSDARSREQIQYAQATHRTIPMQPQIKAALPASVRENTQIMMDSSLSLPRSQSASSQTYTRLRDRPVSQQSFLRYQRT